GTCTRLRAAECCRPDCGGPRCGAQLHARAARARRLRRRAGGRPAAETWGSWGTPFFGSWGMILARPGCVVRCPIQVKGDLPVYDILVYQAIVAHRPTWVLLTHLLPNGGLEVLERESADAAREEKRARVPAGEPFLAGIAGGGA